MLSNFFLASEAENLNSTSRIDYPDTITSSVNEPSKILLTEDPSSLPCSPNPPNVPPRLGSPERPTHPHTNSQRQNSPKYYFHLVLISADDLPDHHYENPPKVFLSSQQTLKMEGHQPSHDLFIKYTHEDFGKI